MANRNHEMYTAIYDGIEVVDALQTRITDIKTTLKIVTELNKWDYRYAEGKWSIKELVQHCIDCERIFSYRALHIARKDPQSLNFFDENEYVKYSNASDRSPEDLIKEWISLMTTSYLQFAAYNDNVLNTTGKIGDTDYSVEHIGYVLAGHSIHHMNIINERYL
jgi:aminopeptidase C